jgi:hypothetical protein
MAETAYLLHPYTDDGNGYCGVCGFTEGDGRAEHPLP